MKEDFVTYEQALALNKLGFREECLYYYNRGGMLVSNYYDSSDGIYVENLYISYNSRHKITNKYDAPTLAQAQKWLRKEKNLYVCVEIDITDTVNNIFYWTIYKLPYKKQIRKTRKFDSPEEALSAGISEVIKFLENG